VALGVALGLGCFSSLYAQKSVTDSLGISVTDSLAAGVLREGMDSLRTLLAPSPKKPESLFKPIPRRATYYALALPGLGQIYTRDYWKLPFVYASFLGASYFIHVNTANFNSFRRAYEGFYDLETAALRPGVQSQEVAVRSFDYLFRDSKIVRRNFALDQVKRGTSVYRRYRDVSYAFLIFAYALSAIEANVAAHLKNFDISEDLSLQVSPTLVAPQNQLAATPGIRLQLTFR
jgi:hypothetical protein